MCVNVGFIMQTPNPRLTVVYRWDCWYVYKHHTKHAIMCQNWGGIGPMLAALVWLWYGLGTLWYDYGNDVSCIELRQHSPVFGFQLCDKFMLLSIGIQRKVELGGTSCLWTTTKHVRVADRRLGERQEQCWPHMGVILRCTGTRSGAGASPRREVPRPLESSTLKPWLQQMSREPTKHCHGLLAHCGISSTSVLEIP